MEKQQEYTIISLFDGISLAYVAAKKVGLKINKYYSSEIDQYCLKLQDYHYSDDEKFIKIGDVKNVKAEDFKDVKGNILLVFGSPCTQLSAANSTDRSGLEGKDSGLFYEALRIYKELIEQFPLKKIELIMENVWSMKNAERIKISEKLSEVAGQKIEPIFINSATLSAQNRRRLYWSTIPNVKQPEPTNIQFKDIIENGYVDKDKSNPILTSNTTLTCNGLKRYNSMNMGILIFKDDEFCKLSKAEKQEQCSKLTESVNYNSKIRNNDEYNFPNGVFRHPSILEYERLQTIPEGYVDDVEISKTQKLKAIGNSFTTDVIAHILQNLKVE